MSKKLTQSGPPKNARIFRPRAVRALGAPIGTGDYPNAVQQGSTAHYNVYYDPALGVTGVNIANGVLAVCERDYNTIAGYFGGITPAALPFNLVIADLTNSTVGACGSSSPPGGGAYHCGCADTTIYCDIKTSPAVDPNFTEFLNIAEIVEVFEAAQNKGWDCGASNGEGLSRVLATALYPGELDGFHTADLWLDGSRPDFVNQTNPTDQDGPSNGCAVLFLNYLRYQLGFSWNMIVQSAGSTLAATYAALTSDKSDPFPRFKAILDGRFPPGKPSGLTTDNPWPIGSPIPSPTASPTSSPTPSPVPSPLPSPTASPTPSPLPSPTASPTPSPTPSPIPSTPSPTSSPTPSPVPSPLPSPTSLRARPMPKAKQKPRAIPKPMPKPKQGGSKGKKRR